MPTVAFTGRCAGASLAASLCGNIVYDIFKGDASGGPIDYTSPIATSSSLTYVTASLAMPSRTLFGVRARDQVSGYSDLNTDATALIIVDGAGNDATNQPLSPGGFRVFAGPGGTAIVEWTYPHLIQQREPLGFHVYQGTPTISYGASVATVLWSARISRQAIYRATLSGLSDGVVYQVGVRAYNASGEEENTVVKTVTGSVTLPGNVTALSGSLMT